MFGYERTDRRGAALKHPSEEIVSDFSGHDHVEVSEYAIWALWRNPKNLRFQSDRTNCRTDIEGFTWRSAVGVSISSQNKKTFLKNLEVFQMAILVETDRHAKEGLALALAKHFHSSFELPLAKWFALEPDLIVKVALLDHFSRFGHRSKLYQELVINVIRGTDRTAIRGVNF